jgi:hypothetical protein
VYYSIPLLHNKLPERFLSHWNTLRLAFLKFVDWQISREDVDSIRQMLPEFGSSYEGLYYRHLYSRLPCMTSNVHGLLHLADYIGILGPSHTHWAFPMERFCGKIQPLARSKVYIDECTSNGLVFDMYLQMSQFCRQQVNPLVDELRGSDDDVDDDALSFASDRDSEWENEVDEEMNL